jgi:hypothetical protein
MPWHSVVNIPKSLIIQRQKFGLQLYSASSLELLVTAKQCTAASLELRETKTYTVSGFQKGLKVVLAVVFGSGVVAGQRVTGRADEREASEADGDQQGGHLGDRFHAT